MVAVTMKQLLEAGVHFGHQTRRWNPKMARYIFAERNGIYIIDLQKTLRHLQAACEYVQEIAARGGSVLFVGTKKQSQETVMEEATRCQMFYVNNRWLGGMLTNFQTIKRSIQRLEKLESDEATGIFDQLPKKEVIRLGREKTKLTNNLGGIQTMGKLPEAVVITDARKEHTAVQEARKLQIPIIAIVDTNCDPDPIDMPIPANDDAIRAIKLICSVLATAVIEGRATALEGADDAEGAARGPQATQHLTGDEAAATGEEGSDSSAELADDFDEPAEIQKIQRRPGSDASRSDGRGEPRRFGRGQRRRRPSRGRSRRTD